MASDDGLMWLVVISFRSYLIENGDDKDCSFAHTRFGLAEYILALECERDGLDLHFTGMFEAALSDGSFELIFEEKLIPAGKIGALIFLIELFGFLIV